MLKNALFFVKSWKNRRSVGGSAPKPLLAGPRPPPNLLISINLRVTFEHCLDFLASLKLRPIISYVSDGWAPLAKLAPWLKPLVTPLAVGCDQNPSCRWQEGLGVKSPTLGDFTIF